MPVSDQKIDVQRFQLIPRTLIFIQQGERILLLRGSESKTRWAGMYNGIGGHVESGEDLLEAAQREFREETGFEAPDLRLAGVLTIDVGSNPGVGIYIFWGEIGTTTRTFELTQAGSEEGSLEWVNIRDLDQYPLVEDLPELLEVLIKEQKSQNPVVGFYWYTQQGEQKRKFYPSL